MPTRFDIDLLVRYLKSQLFLPSFFPEAPLAFAGKSIRDLQVADPLETLALDEPGDAMTKSANKKEEPSEEHQPLFGRAPTVLGESKKEFEEFLSKILDAIKPKDIS